MRRPVLRRQLAVLALLLAAAAPAWAGWCAAYARPRRTLPGLGPLADLAAAVPCGTA